MSVQSNIHPFTMTQDFSALVFDANNLDMAGLITQLHRYSCLVIRNVFKPADLRMFYKRALRAYMVRDWQMNHGQLPANMFKNMYEANHILMTDIDESVKEPYSFIKLFGQSCLKDVGKQIWQDNFCVIGNNSLPRRQIPLNKGGASGLVPFHQDAAFLRSSRLTLNFWIPLIACGDTSPGLEVVTATLNDIIETTGEFDGHVSGPYKDIDLSEQWIADTYGRENFWHPSLALGDVLLFTDTTLHRTYATEEMTKQRISVEVRCGDISTLDPHLNRNVLQFNE